MANGDKPPGGAVSVLIGEHWKESEGEPSFRSESINIPCKSKAEAQAIYDRVTKAVNDIKAEYPGSMHGAHSEG